MVRKFQAEGLVQLAAAPKVSTTIAHGKVIRQKIHHAHTGATTAATLVTGRAPTGAIHGTMFLLEDKVHLRTGEPQEVRAAVSLEVQQVEHHIAEADTRGAEIKIKHQV